MSISVGLVIVSHSADIAAGVVALAQQMAPEVQLKAAGGMDNGGIGTSYDLIEAAVAQLRAQDLDVAIYTDLGSATMTAEMVVDMLGDAHVQLVDAPLVEGAIAGAVAAQQGKSLAALQQDPEHTPDGAAETPATTYERSATVADPVGLHARPAAAVANLAAQGTHVTINGEAADSAMSLMALGIAHGDAVTVSGAPEDAPVVDQIVTLLETSE